MPPGFEFPPDRSVPYSLLPAVWFSFPFQAGCTLSDSCSMRRDFLIQATTGPGRISETQRKHLQKKTRVSMDIAFGQIQAKGPCMSGW